MDNQTSTEKIPSAESSVRSPGTASERGPEVQKSPEIAPERAERGVASEERGEKIPSGVVVTAPSAASVPPAETTRDPLLAEVELEMEEGLWDVYRELPPDLRSRFKAEGERIAHVIRDGIAAGTLVARKVIEMITAWLRMIPHVNKWFLRQEAKNKTDDLMKISRDYRKEIPQ